MKSTVAAFVIAFLISAALTPVVRQVAIRAGVMDEAGGRRVHTGRIPRLGGLAVAVAFFTPLVALFVLDSAFGRLFFDDPGRIVGMGVGGALVLILGGVDDLKGVSPKNKLLVQSAAALIAWWGGYDIRAVALPFVGQIDFGVFSLPVTVLWFVGVINALNLIDGLDGLAAGIAFFACVTNLVVGAANDSIFVVLLSGALGGALLGFLVYNFHPASIFMGDAGSMFLGFVLAATSLLGSSIKSSTTVAILVPVLALGVPITDTVWAFARRLKQKRSIFSPDRGHIHHILIDMGLSQRRAVVLLYAFSLTLTIAAIALALGRSAAAGSALIVMSITLVAIVRTARTFALDRGPPIRQRPRLPIVEALRHRVPELLNTLERTHTVSEAVALIEGLTNATGLGACSVTLPLALRYAPGQSMPPPETLRPPSMPPRRIVFPLEGLSADAQLVFRLPTAPSNEQMHILLQLVADGLQRCLHRIAKKHESAEARYEEASTGESNRAAQAHRLSTVGPTTA